MEHIQDGLLGVMEQSVVDLPKSVETADLHMLDQHVHASIPFLITGGAKTLNVSIDEDSILASIQNKEVPVAVTPSGRADAPLGSFFALPHIQHMAVVELIDKLGHPEQSRVYYMQSQDDNLRNELSGVRGVPVELSAVAETSHLLRDPPEAANLWIGGLGTVSRLHNDNYENIYVQLAGSKTMFLLPPSHVHMLEEQFLQPAVYSPNPSHADQWDLHPVENGHKILFPTIDPHSLLSSPRQPIVYVVKLNPGDALFIPALWYHQVEVDSEGLNLSANYWFTPTPGNPLWSHWNFLRRASLKVRGLYDPDYFD